MGLLVSQLNNYTLSPISDERVSEAASVNSAAGSFGLSFGLAFAGGIMLGIMLASLSTIYIGLYNARTVLPTAEKQQVATVLEEYAQVMSDAQLAGQPEDFQNEIIRINTEARPLALQIALFVPILACLAGLGTSFRMMRIPGPKPAGAGEGTLLG